MTGSRMDDDDRVRFQVAPMAYLETAEFTNRGSCYDKAVAAGPHPSLPTA